VPAAAAAPSAYPPQPPPILQGCKPPGNTSNYLVWPDRMWELVTSAATYLNAQTYCAAKAGRLVTFKDAAAQVSAGSAAAVVQQRQEVRVDPPNLVY
jgi:hypothetical protein